MSDPQPSEQPAVRNGDLDQVQWCREGLLDPAARPDVRRKWANRLILLNTLESKDVAAAILARADNPDAQRAIADAIAENARTNRQLLDESFVAPLIELLGHANPDLRAAATHAMAEFPDPDLIKKLGALVADAATTPAKRLAIVDVLALNVHRRDVIDQLISLIELKNREVTNRVTAVLQPISRTACGSDAKCWRTWWETQSTMREEERLTEQLQIYRDRALATQGELDNLRESTRKHEAIVAARTLEFLRNDYRQLPPEQRDIKLAEWLKDPLNEVALGAIEIIKGRFADEGQKPEGALLTTLLQLLKEGSPPVRREVIQIVQNLNEPEVVQALMTRLESEDDAQARTGLFRALGKLGAVDALSLILRELVATTTSPECARESAAALAQIAAKPEAAAKLSAMVEPLNTRYKNINPDDTGLRAALLTAMAGVGDKAFAQEFLDALESTDPSVLRPAIRGVRTLGNSSKLARLRTLTADKDAFVRRNAVEAISQLGRDDADYETLVPRINPTVEPDEAVRQTAWVSFLNCQKRKSIGERMKAVERLRDMPDLELRYMEELANDLSTLESARPELDQLRDHLATALMAQGKCAGAVPYLRELYSTRAARGDASTDDISKRWLEAVLKFFNTGELTELLRMLIAAAHDDDARDQILSTVSQYAASAEVTADADRTRKLLAELRALPAELYNDHWQAFVQSLSDRVVSTK